MGNKSDLNYLREVTAIEGNELAFNNHFHFKETSTIENNNSVADAFQTIIETTNFDINKKEKNKKDKNDKKNKKNNCLLI